MAKIKVGIVGTGGMANAHANALREIPGCEAFMAMDVVPGRAEAFAEQQGVPWATESIDDVMTDCDAVCIVTPDRFHAEPTLAALRRGLHVLCEKPLTVTLDEAKKVARAAVKAADKHGSIHMTNFSYRNSAAFHHAAKLVADGKLGEVRHVYGRYLQSWVATDVWGNWTKEAWLWRLQTGKGSGGVLGDVGCHLLDFLTGIAGDASSIRCSFHNHPKVSPTTGRPVTKWKGGELDANDTAIIELELDGGGSAVAHTTRWATGRANQVALEVYGTEGALMIDLDRGYNRLWVVTKPMASKTSREPDWKQVDVRPTPNMWKRFITSIKAGRNDACDMVRGAQVQSYLDACERSAADGGSPKRLKAWV
ncbi:MAG: Gfo/Idh/MocA family oxidoreductase [Planctomycetota bacterium]